MRYATETQITATYEINNRNLHCNTTAIEIKITETCPRSMFTKVTPVDVHKSDPMQFTTGRPERYTIETQIGATHEISNRNMHCNTTTFKIKITATCPRSMFTKVTHAISGGEGAWWLARGAWWHPRPTHLREWFPTKTGLVEPVSKKKVTHAIQHPKAIKARN
jgi:hypothetical protein